MRKSNPPAIKCLNQIRAPALALVGDRDLADFRAISDLLAQGIPHATKVVLPGVGHMSNMEGSEQLNRIALQFLTSLAGLKT
jgi:3-oxoadipate enol-lactonase